MHFPRVCLPEPATSRRSLRRDGSNRGGFMQRAKLLFAALFCFVPMPCFATKPDATIVVTTGDDVSGDPGQCSLREAFDNVNAGGKVGTNNCAAAVVTNDDEFTEIQLDGI